MLTHMLKKIAALVGTRRHRFFSGSIIVAALLLILSPLMYRLNEVVGDRRDDGIGTAYFMRGDVLSMFLPGGLFLMIGGAAGLSAMRNVKGNWAQAKAALAAMGVYAFAVGTFSKGLLALVFVDSIYDTSVAGRGNDPMHVDQFRVVKMYVLFGSLAIYCAAMLWMHRRYRSPSIATCKNCSYDLTGNTSGQCPECGEPI